MKAVFHEKEAQQITVLDNRFYTNDNKSYYPSVTTILEVYPKGFGFEQFLKDVGSNAKEIVERAAEQGSKVHAATEHLHTGSPLKWADEEGKPIYTLKEWEMILKFKAFWDKYKPELIANEKSFCSESLGFGGTLDRVIMLAGVRFLVDIKTSNYLHKSHELQLAAYATLWNELNPSQPIEQTAILWLNASTRTEKTDLEKHIYQGSGWQLKCFDRHYTDSFRIFQHTHALWKEENPVYKPLNQIYPDTITL